MKTKTKTIYRRTHDLVVEMVGVEMMVVMEAQKLIDLVVRGWARDLSGGNDCWGLLGFEFGWRSELRTMCD